MTPPSNALRLANLKTMLHGKALHLFKQQTELFNVATEYYKKLGRGAVFIKFRDAQQVMEKGVRVILLYLPLEKSLVLEYDELPRQLQAYNPLQEYVLLLTVTTPLVEGGELLQVSTGRMSPVAQVPMSVLVKKPGAREEMELVANDPAAFTRLLERESSFDSVTDVTTAAGFCAFCYNVRPAFKCARCAMAFYCTKHCQRLHWKEAHKRTCRVMQLGSE